MHSIDANVLAEWIQQGKNFLLIDVREVFEHEILNIGGYNIPLSVAPAKHCRTTGILSFIVLRVYAV